jgi:bifunctional UDP-N-acetylglucosamine pyrophosphorylase / glucosamine-1-phosphate N-acetyltransferase
MNRKNDLQMKAVILAAGKSKRMRSNHTKMVHKILGKEIINFLLDSLVDAGFKENNIILVCSDQNIDALKGVIDRDVQYTIQEKQLGTADALLAAKEHIKDFKGQLLVTVGDNPYITAEEIKKLIHHHSATQSKCTFISAVFPFTPPPYGRVIKNEKGEVTGVIEEIDATPEQLEIQEVNSSIYMFNNDVVYPLLLKIDNKNSKGEYYLTDIIQLLRDRDRKIEAVQADDYFISIGINNRWELQEAHAKFNDAHLKELSLETGVTIFQTGTVTIEYNVEIGKDTIVYPNTYIAAGTRIGKNCEIGPFAYLKNVIIGDNQKVTYEKREA